MLVAGGAWATLFVLPALAAEAPDVLEAGLPSVVVGYIASYAVFCVGWIWTGIALLRARIVPTWLGVLVAVSGALAFVPGPGRSGSLRASSIAASLARPADWAAPVRAQQLVPCLTPTGRPRPRPPAPHPRPQDLTHWQR